MKPTEEELDAVMERLSWHDDDVVIQYVPINVPPAFQHYAPTLYRTRADMARLEAASILITTNLRIEIVKPFRSSDGIMFPVKK